MPTLHELQSDFRRFLTGEASEQLLRLVDGAGSRPESRLSIYRNNMLATLTAALKATFPVVCRLVDERFFDYAADAFIRHNLPANPCLAEYGGDFPEFLAGFPPAGGLAYLPDVARLEWAINRVLRAPHPAVSIPLTWLLGQADPAQTRLCMVAASAYIASPYAIDTLWRRNQPGVAAMEFVLEQAGVYLEIHGAGGLRITHLPAPVWTFRARIADGATLGTAAAEALAIAPDFDLALALARLFEANLVSGFR